MRIFRDWNKDIAAMVVATIFLMILFSVLAFFDWWLEWE